METEKLPKLIHAARRMTQEGSVRYLFLRKREHAGFAWFEDCPQEQGHPAGLETGMEGDTIGLAMQQARRTWKQDSFRTVICGFRYTLPERDEHGCNALFHQMVASYSNSNGIYFDEELGHNCIVQAASQEALALWKRLRQEGRL